MSLTQADWLAFCRRAAGAARDVVNGYAIAERATETGRGEGGDMALVIDRAAEDAVFAELEALGEPVTAVSEERGQLERPRGDRPGRRLAEREARAAVRGGLDRRGRGSAHG